MRRPEKILIIGVFIFICILIFIPMAPLGESTYHYETENASYFVHIEPAFPKGGDHVTTTIVVQNKGNERINGTIDSAFSHPFSIPPGSSQKFTDRAILHEEKRKTWKRMPIIIDEGPGENAYLYTGILIRPNVPPKTPMNVFLGVMTIFIGYSTIVMLSDLFLDAPIFHEEPIRNLIGVLVGSFLSITSNEWVWSLFGFLRDGVVIFEYFVYISKPYVAVLSILMLVYYFDRYTDAVEVDHILEYMKEVEIKRFF